MTLSASLQRCRGLSEGVPWNVSAHCRVQDTFQEGRCPCQLRLTPRQSCPLKRAPCTPPKPCGDDDDDSDDDLGIGAVLKFIVIIVTYRHPVVRQRRIRLPALLRLLVYST